MEVIGGLGKSHFSEAVEMGQTEGPKSGRNGRSGDSVKLFQEIIREEVGKKGRGLGAGSCFSVLLCF